jgi:hypothetical protein
MHINHKRLLAKLSQRVAVSKNLNKQALAKAARNESGLDAYRTERVEQRRDRVCGTPPTAITKNEVNARQRLRSSASSSWPLSIAKGQGRLRSRTAGGVRTSPLSSLRCMSKADLLAFQALGFAWYSVGAFTILGCIVGIPQVLIEAASSPKIVDHGIRWTPAAYGKRPDADQYDREEAKAWAVRAITASLMS